MAAPSRVRACMSPGLRSALWMSSRARSKTAFSGSAFSISVNWMPRRNWSAEVLQIMPYTEDLTSRHGRPVSGWMEWLDSRTGIRSLLHEALDEPIPGGAKWAYVFGSGLLFLFVSQIITGVFLAMYYVASADHAHTVVSYIVKVVTAGSFIRSIHAYGSSAIIILL